MLIDSHHHLWKYDAKQYQWITAEKAVLKKDFLVQELRQIAAECGVDGFVTVQARQSFEETDALLEIAASEPLMRGVVGWVPLSDRKIASVLDRYAESTWLKGVRHVVHDEPDDQFILGSEFNRGVAELSGRGLVYDILIFAKHLPSSIEFVDRHRGLPMVVDHIAKPEIRAAQRDQKWEQDIRELAKRENVICKFSGVVTEVRDPDWTIDTIRPYWETALEALTPKRLMFGSDWPVCLLRTNYREWVETVKQLASELSQTEQEDIFALNAVRVYDL